MCACSCAFVRPAPLAGTALSHFSSSLRTRECAKPFKRPCASRRAYTCREPFGPAFGLRARSWEAAPRFNYSLQVSPRAPHKSLLSDPREKGGKREEILTPFSLSSRLPFAPPHQEDFKLPSREGGTRECKNHLANPHTPFRKHDSAAKQNFQSCPHTHLNAEAQ